MLRSRTPSFTYYFVKLYSTSNYSTGNFGNSYILCSMPLPKASIIITSLLLFTTFSLRLWGGIWHFDPDILQFGMAYFYLTSIMQIIHLYHPKLATVATLRLTRTISIACLHAPQAVPSCLLAQCSLHCYIVTLLLRLMCTLTWNALGWDQFSKTLDIHLGSSVAGTLHSYFGMAAIVVNLVWSVEWVSNMALLYLYLGSTPTKFFIFLHIVVGTECTLLVHNSFSSWLRVSNTILHLHLLWLQLYNDFKLLSHALSCHGMFSPGVAAFQFWADAVSLCSSVALWWLAAHVLVWSNSILQTGRFVDISPSGASNSCSP